MDRRKFIVRSSIFTAGSLVAASTSTYAKNLLNVRAENLNFNVDLYQQFKNPDMSYLPFVRWWWCGDKVEAKEIVRQLRMLKAASVGGVLIYPVAFPSTGDDAGIPSLRWLSPEWIDMLKVAFTEAEKLGMTCDLIVGSGWPFGSETIPVDERAEAVYISAVKVKGPIVYETSQFNIIQEVDPKVTVPNPMRRFEIMSIQIVPDPMNGLDDIKDYSDQKKNNIISINIPAGDHYVYALVKVHDFCCVINGAPGAAGPIVDHFNPIAVRRYLDRMTDTIQKKIGPLSKHVRGLFSDSMELEGENWCKDLPEEFKKRRGYDIMPYAPYVMWNVGRLGAVISEDYGVKKTPAFNEIIKRARFDLELTKAELVNERFLEIYHKWCNDNGMKSYIQAYGRGFFPLDSSLVVDIPEGESWTTNYLRHKVGEEMRDDEYRYGRAYTMINKYVSSAAHLSGKRHVSSEEMTDTYKVFNTSLEFLKLGSDMSAMSGITHPVWHGFNYSPPEAPFPGWVLYGAYYNENNPWWPYFKYLNEYRGRISSQLLNSDVYTDIAIMPADYDLWAEHGFQTDPFPERLNVEYTSLIWEAIHKNGGGADYITETVIRKSTVNKGKLCYGPKAYGTIFLPEVTSIGIDTLQKLHEFILSGGRIFCIEKYPEKSLGLYNYEVRDKEVKDLIDKMKLQKDRFILIQKPADNRFLEWYQNLMVQYKLPHYVKIETPDRFLYQNRYQSDNKSEIIYITNCHLHNPISTKLTFEKEITNGRYPWIWDANTGETYRIELNNGSFNIFLGPAESYLIVFNNKKDGPKWNPKPLDAPDAQSIKGWILSLKHGRDGWVRTTRMDYPRDLKDTEFINFMGEVTYKTKIKGNKSNKQTFLNLGKVWGVAHLFINGTDCGVTWFGNRVYDVTKYLREGDNDVEVKVVTSMGNYMRTLTDNDTAVKFTGGRKAQPVESMGIGGPVTLYSI